MVLKCKKEYVVEVQEGSMLLKSQEDLCYWNVRRIYVVEV